MKKLNQMRIVVALMAAMGLTACKGVGGKIVGILDPGVASRKIYVDSTTLNLSEGGAAVIQIAALDRYDTDLEIDLHLTGSSGRFQALPSSVTLVAGDLTTSVTLQTVNDTIYQGAESFTFSISTSDAAVTNDQFVIALGDDESSPELTIADVTVNETDGTATLTISQNRTSTLDSDFVWETTDGTATAGSDFDGESAVSGTIEAGQTSTTVEVDLNDDSDFEASEALTVDLDQCTNCTISDAQATVTIQDDDAVELNFAAATQNFSESSGRRGGAWPSTLSAWGKRRQLRINNLDQAESFTDFPILVKLNSSRIDYGATAAQGADLRFTDSAGTVLAHEIETWSTSGDSFIWVKVPSIAASSAAGFIMMYYDNPAATDAQNKTGVWTDSYSAVWHLDNTNDSTANANNSTNGAGSTTSSTTLFGNGRYFNGWASLNMGNSTSLKMLSGEVTMEVWFKTNALFADKKIMGQASGYAYGSYKMGLYSNNHGEMEVSHPDSSNTNNRGVGGGTVINSTQWYHMTSTFSQSGDLLATYINGVLDRSSTTTKDIIADQTGNFAIGSEVADGGGNFHGYMDEARVRSTASSPAYIKAQYLSQIDGLLFYGPEEASTAGVVTVTVNLSAATSQNVTIPYTISGTAGASDHDLVDGSLVINAGDTSGVIEFYVTNDFSTEGDETVIVTIDTPTNGVTGATGVHTVTIQEAANSAPVATDDTASQNGITQFIIPILSNDTDADGEMLRITAVTTNGAGVASIQGQTIVYTPTNFTNPGVFTYTITDERGATTTATLTVNP